MTAPLTIAIDGPSGSGKSSVSKAVARRLGVGYLDTGAMYRALTWWCLERGLDLTDTDAVAAAARDLPLEIGTDPDAPTVSVDGTDVSEAIRTTRGEHRRLRRRHEPRGARRCSSSCSAT